jgi:hypothetical protein
MNLERIEYEETRNSHHGGFPNFGREVNASITGVS